MDNILKWIKLLQGWYLLPYVNGVVRGSIVRINSNRIVSIFIRPTLTSGIASCITLDYSSRNTPPILKELTNLAHEMWPEAKIDLSEPKQKYKSLMGFNV